MVYLMTVLILKCLYCRLFIPGYRCACLEIKRESALIPAVDRAPAHRHKQTAIESEDDFCNFLIKNLKKIINNGSLKQD